jgi:hypothetical protein
MQKTGALLKDDAFTPSLVDLDPDQPRGAFVRHHPAGPAIAGIIELLVTPKHLEVRAGGFLPLNFVVSVAFPRRRVAGHEVDLERCWPAENAVTRDDERVIAHRRRSSETLSIILGCGFKRAEREDFAAARQRELVVLG